MANGGKRIDLWTTAGDGEVLITENVPGHWIVTWLPPQGHPDWPGFTFSSSLNSDMPTEDGTESLLVWALGQPWAQRRSAS